MLASGPAYPEPPPAYYAPSNHNVLTCQGCHMLIAVPPGGHLYIGCPNCQHVLTVPQHMRPQQYAPSVQAPAYVPAPSYASSEDKPPSYPSPVASPLKSALVPASMEEKHELDYVDESAEILNLPNGRLAFCVRGFFTAQIPCLGQYYCCNTLTCDPINGCRAQTFDPEDNSFSREEDWRDTRCARYGLLPGFLVFCAWLAIFIFELIKLWEPKSKSPEEDVKKATSTMLYVFITIMAPIVASVIFWDIQDCGNTVAVFMRNLDTCFSTLCCCCYDVMCFWCCCQKTNNRKRRRIQYLQKRREQRRVHYESRSGHHNNYDCCYYCDCAWYINEWCRWSAWGCSEICGKTTWACCEDICSCQWTHAPCCVNINTPDLKLTLNEYNAPDLACDGCHCCTSCSCVSFCCYSGEGAAGAGAGGGDGGGGQGGGGGGDGCWHRLSHNCNCNGWGSAGGGDGGGGGDCNCDKGCDCCGGDCCKGECCKDCGCQNCNCDCGNCDCCGNCNCDCGNCDCGNCDCGGCNC